MLLVLLNHPLCVAWVVLVGVSLTSIRQRQRELFKIKPFLAQMCRQVLGRLLQSVKGLYRIHYEFCPYIPMMDLYAEIHPAQSFVLELYGNAALFEVKDIQWRYLQGSWSLNQCKYVLGLPNCRGHWRTCLRSYIHCRQR